MANSIKSPVRLRRITRDEFLRAKLVCVRVKKRTQQQRFKVPFSKNLDGGRRRADSNNLGCFGSKDANKAGFWEQDEVFRTRLVLEAFNRGLDALLWDTPAGLWNRKTVFRKYVGDSTKPIREIIAVIEIKSGQRRKK